MCLFRRLLGVRCPGCGMARALAAMLTGDVSGAWASNPLSLLVGPLLGWVWIREVLDDLRALGAIGPAGPPTAGR